MFEVHVKSASATLSVPPETTVLDAALAAGIAYPHGCRTGRCGACKSRLIEGQVDLLKHTPFALTDQEKRNGMILACRAVPRTACAVAWLGSDSADHPLRDEAATVLSVLDATHDIKTVRVGLAGAVLGFSAGQYVELTFPGCPPRHYSMANRPRDEILEFHIRRVPGGAASEYVACSLRRGDRVRLRGPFGTAHLRLRQSGPMLAIAGGSGLAPIISIVKTALHEGLRQPIHVFYGARTERDVYGEKRFSDLSSRYSNLTFTPILSEARGVTMRRTGLVTDVVAQDFTRLEGCTAYIAGPPPMVQAASELLLERGLKPDSLHADAFFTSADQASVATGELTGAL